MAVRAVLSRRVFGKPLGAWLLWTAAIGVLISCPAMLSDPGMWPYLLDPELLLLVVLVGAQYTRLELGVFWLQTRAWWRQRRARTSTSHKT
jgi:hypothetical protein